MTARPAVLVTGGARRLGAAIVRAFAGAGWHVVIHCNRSRGDADALAASLPSAEVVQCELTDADAVHAMAAEVSGRLSDWRVLVNCASVFHPDAAALLDPSVFREAMAVNAAAPTMLADAFLAHAMARGGRRVIAITDQKLANPNPDFFSYTMSKHALAATVPMLAMRQARSQDRSGDRVGDRVGDRAGDRVYAIAPGAILASHDQSEEETERSHRMNLLGRKTGADEIGTAALFLAGGWLASGSTLFIDSGQHLLAQPRDVLYLARERA